METETKESSRERDIIKALEPVALKNIGILTDKRPWSPADFFNFMEKEDYQGNLSKLREQAKSLNDGLLVVLIGNTVTEEALPNYSSRLANIFPDPTGISKNPWALWSRGWNAEEDQHGRVLDNYLLLTGRVNMGAVEKSIFSLIKSGFAQSPSLTKALLYPTFQELATKVSHLNVAIKAEKLGEETLERMCKFIASDEQRHGKFYLEASKGLFDLEPNKTMIEYQELLKEGIVMPARLMTDGVYTQAPTLFDNFAEVAMSEGIYTSGDYANILRSLNSGLNIANRSVSGESAKAQEYLMKLPSRIERIAERKGNVVRQPIGFDWIYGRKA